MFLFFLFVFQKMNQNLALHPIAVRIVLCNLNIKRYTIIMSSMNVYYLNCLIISMTRRWLIQGNWRETHALIIVQGVIKPTCINITWPDICGTNAAWRRSLSVRFVITNPNRTKHCRNISKNITNNFTSISKEMIESLIEILIFKVIRSW